MSCCRVLGCTTFFWLGLSRSLLQVRWLIFKGRLRRSASTGSRILCTYYISGLCFVLDTCEVLAFYPRARNMADAIGDLEGKRSDQSCAGRLQENLDDPAHSLLEVVLKALVLNVCMSIQCLLVSFSGRLLEERSQ